MSQKHYRSDALEAIARRTLSKLGAGYASASPRATPVERLIEGIYKLEIEYKYLTNNGRILGKTIFDDGYTPFYDAENRRYDLLKVKKGTMLIDAALLAPEKKGRLRFTQAHELAHWILHQEVFSGTGEAAALMSSDQDTALEWQANVLATNILMPAGQIKQCYYMLSEKHMDRPSIIEKMAEVFDVSKQAMRIRLESRGLL